MREAKGWLASGGKKRETQHFLYLAPAFLLGSQVGELGFPGKEPNSWKGSQADEDGWNGNQGLDGR